MSLVKAGRVWCHRQSGLLRTCLEGALALAADMLLAICCCEARRITRHSYPQEAQSEILPG